MPSCWSAIRLYFVLKGPLRMMSACCHHTSGVKLNAPSLSHILSTGVQPGHNTALNLQTLLSRHTLFGCFSHLGTSWGGWTAKSFATCYASDNALVVFTISFIAEQQTIQLFLSLPTTCPPARSPAKPSSAQNRFSNQHPIVGFSPVSGSDISQAQLSSAYPPSPAPMPLFLQSLWK